MRRNTAELPLCAGTCSCLHTLFLDRTTWTPHPVKGRRGENGRDVDDVLGEVFGVWRCKTNADFPIDRCHGVQQLGEAQSSLPSGLVHGREAWGVDGKGVPKGSVQMPSACADVVLARKDAPDCCASRRRPNRN